MSQPLTGLPRKMSTQGVARALLVVLGVSLAVCLWISRTPLPDPPPNRAHPHGTTDAALYRAIVSRVRNGQDYTAAAVAEHRRLGYPLRPFFAVRPPALATFLAVLPDWKFAVALYAALVLAVVLVWWRRVMASREEVRRWRLVVIAGLLSGLAMAMFTSPATTFFTETWAGLLIALSLGLRTDKHFVASVLAGLVAGILRELAIPFLGLMSVLALTEQKRWESAAFFSAMLVALALLTEHGLKVSALASPQDMASQGWVRFGGLAFVLKAINLNIASSAFGLWLAAVLAPFCLLGACSWEEATRRRLFATLSAYLLAFSIIGRPENDYWGFLIAPLVGLCAATGPLVVVNLFRTATRSSAQAVVEAAT